MSLLHAFIGPEDGSATWWQLSLRALILFVAGVAFLRIAGRRTFSQATPLDIVVALIIGSNLSRIMTGKAPVLPGLAATLTLVCLHRILAMATLRWGLLSRWLKSKPVVLVRDGKADEQAMKRHGLSREDLLESLRLEQADRVEDVKLATLEGGGRISVVRADK
ncbi:MAG: DUF421 domain-containing protein [Proteobacteria bacterium]|nr:DUF421 domain-containing protein [Pseudomonadota bacterium]